MIKQSIPFELNQVPYQVTEEGLEIQCPHITLKFKSPFCRFEEGSPFKVIFLKRLARKVKAIVFHWTKLIEKYSKGPLFQFTITPHFCHFPVFIEKKSDHTIAISNFLGLKKQFLFTFEQIDSLEVKDRKITFKTYNDILLGAQINQMIKALRSGTQLKTLDKRVFKDGFLVKKTEL